MEMTPKKFRKLPVEIETIQFLGNEVDGNVHSIIQWIHNTSTQTATWRGHQNELRASNGELVRQKDYEHLTIRTLEGNMRADIGDYIIRGVNGEFYPCKPDIFAKTYEEVTDG